MAHESIPIIVGRLVMGIVSGFMGIPQEAPAPSKRNPDKTIAIEALEEYPPETCVEINPLYYIPPPSAISP